MAEKTFCYGSKCAPSYANNFTVQFEEKFIFPVLTNLSDFYLRFIDDIFLIWNGNKTELDNFLKKTVNAILASNLNMKCLKQKLIFSTPMWCLNQITNCEQSVSKPTDIQSYSHSKLEHPNFTKKGIAYSQALKFSKICYNRSNLHNNCKRLLNTLTKRGYNKISTQQILQHKSTVLLQFQETS